MPDPIEDVLRYRLRFAALDTFVHLGCAEVLAEHPQTNVALATACGCDTKLLTRVLRTLAAAGIVTEKDGRWTLTADGQRLRGDHPDSQRTAVLVSARPELSYALAALPETVRSGKSAFAGQYGSLYDLLRRDPELGELFNDFMDTRSRSFARALPTAFDFAASQTVVDVGGGKGHITAAVLLAHPHLRGMVLELAHMAPIARHYLSLHGLDDRCEVVVGDYFSAVPSGDTYIMSNIVHNLDDEDAVKVLKNVQRAAKRSGSLLCLDMVLPDDGSPHMGWDMDMRMASLFGHGRERVRSEYLRLLEQAGFRIGQISPLPYWHSLIAARF
jgi:ubiquinone/menaquinone biosynthesis C-methylase UbiE